MAGLAVGAHLPAMNIGMTVSALRSDIAEDQTRVTLPARHARVHSSQWVLRLIVVEVGLAANRLPGSERVTVLARHVEVAVRALQTGARLLLGQEQRQQDQQRSRNRFRSSRHHVVFPAPDSIRLIFTLPLA